MYPISKLKDKLRQDGRFWIAFVGDSITSCEWVHPNWREIVEYVLKDEAIEDNNWKLPSWGIRGFNFAYDGATTKDILDKVNDIKLINPDLVILMIGANDPFLKISIEEHTKNLLDIRNEIGTEFVFSTDNKPWDDEANSKYRPYVNADKELDFDNFINLYELSDNFPKEKIYTFKSEENPVENIKEGDLDFWHPNQLGNAYIAKIVLKEVFQIDFDPEKYITDVNNGEKYPNY